MTEGYKDDRYAFVDAYLATGHYGPEAYEELISVAIVEISKRRSPDRWRSFFADIVQG